MKNTHRNIVVLIFASCFLAFNFIGEKAAARNEDSSKPTPTPKAKKSPTPVAKAIPKPATKTTPTPKPTKTPVKSNPAANAKTSPPKNSKLPAATKATPKPSATPKPTPKPVASPQAIITATAVRVRQKPLASAPQLTTVKMGRVLPVAEKNAAWYRVQYAEGKTGWISKTFLRDYDAAKRETIYREIADRYSANKKLDFATAAEVADFLKTAQTEVKTIERQADLSYKRLRILSAALEAVPSGKGEQNPYKTFLTANEAEVFYSDPADEWFVRSDVFWELHGKYIELPIAEEIAWTAAQNPIPGECEGYVNCYLYMLRVTDGEYLNFYPGGKYSKQALQNIKSLLDPIVADLGEKKVYTAPTDISDRAEFNRFLAELRTIISKVPDIEKNKPLQQINQLGEGYK